MTANTENAISFELIENAIDSVSHAIELMAWKDITDERSRLKQAILSVAHGVELLLKERLRKIHPSLVWEDVDKFPRLDARTVSVDKAIHRLQSIGAVKFNEYDTNLIKSLRNTRNAIEHFSWQTTKHEASLIVGQALSFAVHFAKNELGYDFEFKFVRDDTWRQLISNSASFVESHARRHNLENPSAELYFPCDFCHAITVSRYGGACSICGHWSHGDLEEPF